MGFTSLRFFQYRNIVDGVVDVEARQVFLVGENGQGKTNFLEAVYLLSYGSSFRSRSDEVLVTDGRESMAVDGTFADATLGEVTLGVRIDAGRKELRVHGRPVKDRGELVRNVPCVVFCHGDIEFVQGGPDARRRYFDQTAVLAEPEVLDDLRSYRRTLKSRNAALKDGTDSLVSVFDEQLLRYGEAVVEARRRAVEAVNTVFTPLYAEVSRRTRPVRVAYRPSWTKSGGEALDQNRRRDREFGTTTTGPHRDRFVLMSDHEGFVRTASTGQVRLASLVLRAAQAVLLAESHGRPPVLLLDDVLLELDPARRGRFMAVLPEAQQSFFTFLPDEQFAAFAGGGTLVLDVSDGRITPRR